MALAIQYDTNAAPTSNGSANTTSNKRSFTRYVGDHWQPKAVASGPTWACTRSAAMFLFDHASSKVLQKFDRGVTFSSL